MSSLPRTATSGTGSGGQHKTLPVRRDTTHDSHFSWLSPRAIEDGDGHALVIAAPRTTVRDAIDEAATTPCRTAANYAVHGGGAGVADSDAGRSTHTGQVNLLMA